MFETLTKGFRSAKQRFAGLAELDEATVDEALKDVRTALLEALSAGDPERRLRAAQELERISGVYVGYHFDLGRREREAARRRWERWWHEVGRPGSEEV